MNEKLIDDLRIVGNFMGKNYHYPSNYMYDKTWDWLMPVVKKCKELAEWPSMDLQKIDNALLKVDIDLAFQSVVNFIKFHDKFHH